VSAITGSYNVSPAVCICTLLAPRHQRIMGDRNREVHA